MEKEPLTISGRILQPPRGHEGGASGHGPDKKADRDGVGPGGGVVLAGVCVSRQLRALAWLEDAEDDGADE